VIRTVEISSIIPASPEQLWTELGSPRTVASEIGAWLRRTTPPGLRHRTLHTVCVGRDLGASWILLLSVVPVGRQHTTVAARLAGERIELSSRTWATTSWRHERLLETPTAAVGGQNVMTGRTVLRDRVSFEVSPRVARLPGCEALLVRMIAWIFRRRHRRLAARVLRGRLPVRTTEKRRMEGVRIGLRYYDTDPS
jgi:hypothetical protein